MSTSNSIHVSQISRFRQNAELMKPRADVMIAKFL